MDNFDKHLTLKLSILDTEDVIKEIFIGKMPSHFQFNATVKAFIVSESLLWSAWNFITPIFAIFAVNEISGSNLSIAGSVVSIYLIVRVICELISGRYLMKSTEKIKFVVTIIGIILLSVNYLGFAFSSEMIHLFLFYGLAGIGMVWLLQPKLLYFLHI